MKQTYKITYHRTHFFSKNPSPSPKKTANPMERYTDHLPTAFDIVNLLICLQLNGGGGGSRTRVNPCGYRV